MCMGGGVGVDLHWTGRGSVCVWGVGVDCIIYIGLGWGLCVWGWGNVPGMSINLL